MISLIFEAEMQLFRAEQVQNECACVLMRLSFIRSIFSLMWLSHSDQLSSSTATRTSMNVYKESFKMAIDRALACVLCCSRSDSISDRTCFIHQHTLSHECRWKKYLMARKKSSRAPKTVMDDWEQQHPLLFVNWHYTKAWAFLN